eukprot:13226156-Alexandrium_andersonii.AAC.1
MLKAIRAISTDAWTKTGMQSALMMVQQGYAWDLGESAALDWQNEMASRIRMALRHISQAVCRHAFACSRASLKRTHVRY